MMNPRIYYDPSSSAINPWRVRRSIGNGKRQSFGNFPTLEEAETQVKRIVKINERVAKLDALCERPQPVTIVGRKPSLNEELIFAPYVAAVAKPPLLPDPFYVFTKQELADHDAAREKIVREEVTREYEHRLHVVTGSLGGKTRHANHLLNGARYVLEQLVRAT